MSANVNNIIPQARGIQPIDPDYQPDERKQQEQDRTADCPELLTFLKRTCDSIKAQNVAEWEKIINMQVLCMSYFDDRQYGTVKDGVFREAKVKFGDVRPLDNRFQVQVNKLTMEIARSQPKIEVTAADPHNSRKVEAAKFAQHRIDNARRRILKHSERLREAQALLLKMITWRYVFFNRHAASSAYERKPKKEQRSYGATRSIAACKICSGPMKETAAENGNGPGYGCQNCGHDKAKMIELSSRDAEVVTGYDEVRGGDVDSHHIDPLMVRVSLSTRQSVAESPFLWYHQRIVRCILEDAYPERKIKSASGQMNIADRHKYEAQTEGPNTGASRLVSDTGDVNPQGGDQLEECPFDLIWLEPVMYRRRKFSRPQKLLGGRTLPANVDLATLFPDGMCVALNDDQILDVYPENKNKKWLFAVYGIREHALHGTGVTNLIGPQDTRNELLALLVANTHFNATPREFLRQGSLTGNRLPQLNQVAVVADVPAEKPVEGWAYTVAHGTPLPEQTVGLFESQNGAMQEGAGTSSLNAEGAAADVKALGTATGVAAMRDQAVGRMGPNLMLITEMDEDWSYLVLEHELDNFSRERFLRMANQGTAPEQPADGTVTFSADGIKAFMESDPRADFVVRAAPDSWMPRTDAEKQSRFGAFATIAVQVAEKMAGNPAMAARFLDVAANVYGVEMEIDGWTATELLAANRLRAIAQTVSRFSKNRQYSASPDLIQSVLTITPEAAIDNEMDNHLLFISYYREWWASDQGSAASPLLRACVKAMVLLHRAGKVWQEQQMAEDKLAANEPNERKAQEIAAQSGGQGEKGPSVSMSYKDVPPDVARQIEQAAGFQPSQVGQTDETAATTTELAAKTESQLVIQEHKAGLQMKVDEHKAQLEIDKAAATSQLDEERAESDHSRQTELEQSQQDHQTGIEHAKLMNQSANAAAERVHKERVTDKQVKAKENSTANKK